MIRKSLEALLFSFPILLSSCNALTRITESEYTSSLRQKGYNPYHAQSCGPRALYQLFSYYQRSQPARKISKEIIENNTLGNLLRNSLSIFNNNANNITWSWEIKKEIEAHLNEEYYELIKITGGQEELRNKLKELIEKDEQGIALVRLPNNFFSYDWVYFHSASLRGYKEDILYLEDIGKKTGVPTVACEIYLIKEKSEAQQKVYGPIIPAFKQFDQSSQQE